MSIIWNGNQKAGVCHDGGHRHDKAAACENAHSGGNVLCRNHDHLLLLGMNVRERCTGCAGREVLWRKSGSNL